MSQTQIKRWVTERWLATGATLIAGEYLYINAVRNRLPLKGLLEQLRLLAMQEELAFNLYQAYTTWEEEKYQEYLQEVIIEKALQRHYLQGRSAAQA